MNTKEAVKIMREAVELCPGAEWGSAGAHLVARVEELGRAIDSCAVDDGAAFDVAEAMSQSLVCEEHARRFAEMSRRSVDEWRARVEKNAPNGMTHWRLKRPQSLPVHRDDGRVVIGDTVEYTTLPEAYWLPTWTKLPEREDFDPSKEIDPNGNGSGAQCDDSQKTK